MARAETLTGLTLLALTPPGAIAYAGPAFFHELERRHGRMVLADCGTRAGDALAALRVGLRRLLFTGDAELAVRLADIAAQLGADLVTRLDLPVIRLNRDDDLATGCRAWNVTHASVRANL